VDVDAEETVCTRTHTRTRTRTRTRTHTHTETRASSPSHRPQVDAETMKARKWDDWKDANVKGSGNTGLKSMYDCVAFEQENPGYKL